MISSGLVLGTQAGCAAVHGTKTLVLAFAKHPSKPITKIRKLPPRDAATGRITRDLAAQKKTKAEAGCVDRVRRRWASDGALAAKPLSTCSYAETRPSNAPSLNGRIV